MSKQLNTGPAPDRLIDKHRQDIEQAYKKLHNWYKVLEQEVYIDDPPAMTAFIECIEETEGVKIKDAKHLRDLMGLDLEEYKGIEELFTWGRENRYITELEEAIRQGAKYKDLLKMTPDKYGLPKKWAGFYPKKERDQQGAIRWAIEGVCLLLEGPINRPYLRDVAKVLEVPYSYIIDIVTNNPI